MTNTLGCELPEGARHNLRQAIAVLLFIGIASAHAQQLPGPQPEARGKEFTTVVVQGTRWDNWGGNWGGGWSGGGGGPGFDTTIYSPPPSDGGEEPGPNNPEPVAEHLCDNPVDVVTGRKFEFVEDFAHASLAGLQFQRTYNQAWSGVGLLGKQWVTNHDVKLSDRRWPGSPGEGCYQLPGILPCTIGPVSSGTIFAHRETGEVLTFTWSETARAWVGAGESSAARITRLADRTFHLAWGAGNREMYDAGGIMTQRLGPGDVGTTYEYADRQKLVRIRHTSGATISFTWAHTPWGGDRVIQVVDPAGHAYTFDYQSRAASGGHSGIRLSAVTYPDDKAALLYHYDDALRYVGRSVAGVRFTTYVYDAESRVVESRKANGVDRTRYAYSDETRTRTNALGKVTTYRINEGRIVGTTGQASPNCPLTVTARAFDSDGRLESETNESGTVTRFEYDSNGRLARRVEAAGTSVERVRTFAWDEEGRSTRETLQGESERAFAYSPQGWLQRVTMRNLKSGIVAPDRSDDYTYTQHPSGIVASVIEDGPMPGNGDALTYRYSANGDLLSETGAGGHATTFGNYNQMGLPGRTTSPAGAIREFVYDMRGRVVLERAFPNGAPVETRYLYGANGLLDGVHSADGAVVMYHYDAAHRLIQEDRTEPDGTFAVRRITYNAMSQPIRIEVGRD